jgi:hypothetical protein
MKAIFLGGVALAALCAAPGAFAAEGWYGAIERPKIAGVKPP